MSQKRQNIKTNTHITAGQHCAAPSQSQGPHQTPVKKHPSDCSNNLQLAPLSPMPFPPKNNLQFSNELIMIVTPFSKQAPKYLQEQDQDIPIGGSRIIFESIQDENGNNNSSSSNSEQISQESKSLSNESSISNIEEESYDINHNNSRQGPCQQLSGNQSANFRKHSKTKNPSNPSNPSKDADPNRRVFCNCKKTKCLKLYCDCFRLNLKCDENCNCVGCHNLQTYNQQRNNAILSLMDRNPDPFGQKIEANKHVKGCNCKKSNCLKKYCECFQAGLKCNQNCKCQGCKNCQHQKSEQSGEKGGISKLTAKKQKKMVQM